MDFEKLTESIKQHEGFRNFPYTDTVGKLTIGWGHNLSDNGITKDVAELLLSNDIRSAIRTAEAQNWWPYVKDNDVRARAFTEIGFNVGFGALGLFRKAVAAASRDDWDVCADEFLDSKWHAQVGLRAQRLAAMIRTGRDT